MVPEFEQELVSQIKKFLDADWVSKILEQERSWSLKK